MHSGWAERLPICNWVLCWTEILLTYRNSVDMRICHLQANEIISKWDWLLLQCSPADVHLFNRRTSCSRGLRFQTSMNLVIHSCHFQGRGVHIPLTVESWYFEPLRRFENSRAKLQRLAGESKSALVRDSTVQFKISILPITVNMAFNNRTCLRVRYYLEI